MSNIYTKLSKYQMTDRYDFNQDRRMIDIDLSTAFIGIKKAIALIEGLPGSVPGTGDVVGPSSATNNAVALFDGITGKLIKDSGLTLSGTNTGDQFLFKTIAVSGQSDIVADTTTDTLTVVAGSGITITNNASTDTITITGTAPGLELISVTTFSASTDTGQIAITPGEMYRFIFRASVDTGPTNIRMRFEAGEGIGPVNSQGGYWYGFLNATMTYSTDGGNISYFPFAPSYTVTDTVITGEMKPMLSTNRAEVVTWEQSGDLGLGGNYAEYAQGVGSRGVYHASLPRGIIDTFNIFCTGGTMTGSVWLYKYKSS